MSYKVLNDFMETNHNNTVYRKGDEYPKEGFNANPSRVSFLQKVHPTYGLSFLEVPEETTQPTEQKKTKRGQKSGDK